MRLLETSTLELSDFVESQIPKYAILSHTWSEGEVLFRDLEKNPSAKAGWVKIESACRVARERGFPWIWIDTCCIDKASSSELSEAINSMFRWYQKAELCLVYLSDVVYSGSRSYECLAGSRWFTRGWTLQELLAPFSLDFYAQDWRLLGPRDLFCDVIERKTGIERSYLLGARPLERASIAERMSWASQRITTRDEDVAYCLLGIFDINMPLIYGEGTKAFQRLQEAIIRDNDDQSIFAWGNIFKGNADSTPGSLAGWPLLAPSPAYFKDSGDVIPIFNVPSTRMHIEHSGIVIGTPLLAEAPSERGEDNVTTTFLAPLLCRRRNDVFNTIALALHSTNQITPGFNLEDMSYFRVSDWLFTFKMSAWTSERLCSVFICFKAPQVFYHDDYRIFAPNGCAVRTLPKGYSLGDPYNVSGNYRPGEKLAFLPIMDRLPGSSGLVSPFVIPLNGPSPSENNGKEDLALVLQYQYKSAGVDDGGSVIFESKPSEMMNRVVIIPPGFTIPDVARTVLNESEAWYESDGRDKFEAWDKSEAWSAKYFNLIFGVSKWLFDWKTPPVFFRLSSLRTCHRFRVVASTEPLHSKLLIIDVLDLMGEDVCIEVDHYGLYVHVKGVCSSSVAGDND
ncbi:HET domain-containing protein [Colletotrichum cuscutae]|uniref:HET domain-containing protein n=1 Tax=Colletotrichum cuscutae TaxID=1209917 RepID=A0AAI9YDH2_9PEZI|nr:HET domain-containing protein [Colletotrichum cuscutae]